MRILMLGNSFTSANELPRHLSLLTGAEVVAHTRGGARLAEQMNQKTKLGARTRAALKEERWDYVILQEMSNGPITSPERFLESVQKICTVIRQNKAVPVLYGTWAYQEGGKKLEAMGMTYEEMSRQMSAQYHRAAIENGALLADVGQRFLEYEASRDLYAPDGVHPNQKGTEIAAGTLAEVILKDAVGKSRPV